MGRQLTSYDSVSSLYNRANDNYPDYCKVAAKK